MVYGIWIRLGLSEVQYYDVDIRPRRFPVDGVAGSIERGEKEEPRLR